jgi:hypothetical protein
MKIGFLVGCLLGFFQINAQIVYIDNANIRLQIYNLNIQENSHIQKGDTLYFKMRYPAYAGSKLYTLANWSVVNDTCIKVAFVYDSATHKVWPLIPDSAMQNIAIEIKNPNETSVYLSCPTKSSTLPFTYDLPKSAMKNFMVNRIMTSNLLTFEFAQNYNTNYGWSISNASGREVGSGIINAHRPSESFSIELYQLKPGRYSFTIGEGSDSLSEFFTIY